MTRLLLFILFVVLGAPRGLAQPVYFSLDFPGGTLAQYVEAIRDANPDADIFTDERIELFPVAPTRLTNVDLYSSLDLLSGSRIATSEGVLDLSVRAAQIGATGDHIVRLQVEAPVSIPDATEVNVWSLQNLTSLGVSIDDALSAVEVSLTVAPHEAVMKFHEQTKLLIVSGNIRTMHLVDATLEALSKDATAARQSNENSQFRIAELEFEMAEAQADMQLATQHMHYNVSRLDQADEEVENGNLDEQVLLELQLELARSERDLYVAQQRVDLVRKQLKQVRESLGTR
ncbi:MAG: hypothetical protein ACF8GE_03210 [Phycisphaerales bacterium JB043]